MKAGLNSMLWAAAVVCLVAIGWLGPAQAESVFPFGVGYVANYDAYVTADPSNHWNAAIQISGAATVNGQPGWTMQMVNWDGDSQTHSIDVLLTSNTFSMNGPQGLQPYFEELAAGQSWTLTDFQGQGVTATVVSIGSLTLPAATFNNNVYQVHYLADNQDEVQYWLPGLGLVKDVDSTPDSNHLFTYELTSYSTPVPLPAGAWLLGSGLLGLAGWRRVKKS